ncbi:tetraacyldisaccharide 4'-kinase, partial [Candidatus Desantisbacteria bacterium]|nr:tetraacyldisaccharide 4'-kinase [Candidatus Desantisbacteria bacterium]
MTNHGYNDIIIIMMIMYFREIMLGKRKGFIIRLFLRILSLIYFVLIKIRICGYKHGFLREKKLLARVISIGNLTVGGSGKTPAIIEIASLLQDAGKRVGVLIRGYQGNYEHQQGVVSENISPLDAGDEACLFAKNLPGIPVLAGKNRWASGRHATGKFNCDTLLLDDGFQHLKLYR